MKDWLMAMLACQECGGELGMGDKLEQCSEGGLLTGTVECAECELSWPVLGGMPFLLSDPGVYLSTYRESVLASLVEVASASPLALRLVDEFAADHVTEPMRFGDDWTSYEDSGASPELVPGSEERELFARLCRQGDAGGLQAVVRDLLGPGPFEVLMEVGPGAGRLSTELSQVADRLLVVDISLRSLFRSRARAHGAGGEVAGLLADVCDLELASDSCSAIVAANVVDLLVGPEQFLAAAARWLPKGGELILTTPDPSLGGDRDDVLQETLSGLDYSIEDTRDAIPWVRHHSPRHAQIYWIQAIRACIAPR